MRAAIIIDAVGVAENALKCVNHIHDDGYNSNRTIYIPNPYYGVVDEKKTMI